MNIAISSELGKANARILDLERRVDVLLCRVGALSRENEELKLENAGLKLRVSELTEGNKKLREENEKLRKRLKLDSSNSNLPSSSEIFGRRTLSNRDKSDKSSGAQSGHIGSTLKFESVATDYVSHNPGHCEACGLELSDLELIDTRQVHDIEIKKKVTTHYVYAGKCNCGCTTTLETTKQIPHGVSYGNNIKGIMLSLYNHDLIPSDRLSNIAENIFGLSVSEGTIYKWQEEASVNLNQYEEELKAKLQTKDTLHADESGLRVNGSSHWLHVTSTEDLTYYGVDKKRGIDAMNEIGILSNYTGNLMHDCFKSYHNLPNIKQHGLCNAHLLRELKSMDEFYKVSFANMMKDLLLEMNTKVSEAKEQNTQISYQMRMAYKSKFRKLIELARKEAKALQYEIWQKDVLALANRLEEHGDKYLAFLDNQKIPFTNNQAERDIRMIKTKQKISGGFRSLDYAKHFAKIRGFISTMKKQKINVVEALSRIIANHNDYQFNASG
jgi:transposase